jgi:ABC-type antimicrobial peptide transport system permease subunit
MRGVLASSLAFQRFLALVLSLFAALGLLLAVVGVYGLLAYLVAQRTRDIGVRVALGARPLQMVRMILGRSAWLAAIGSAAGVAGALALTRLLEHQLFDVAPTDPGALAAGALIIGAAVLIAGGIPARRAARVDPIISLRSE